MSEREPCQQFVRQWPVGNGEWIDTTGKVCPRCGFMESAHRHTGEDYNEVATVNAEISRRNAEIHEKIEMIMSKMTNLSLVELLSAPDDCAFDQPCAHGHHVEEQAVYCHNTTWAEAPRKCRRTWYTGGVVRDEDCLGFTPNPQYAIISLFPKDA